MFLTKYVCLSPSVSVNNSNFSNQDIHKLKFINSPLYFSFPLVFFTYDGTTKNQCFTTCVTTGLSLNIPSCPKSRSFIKFFRYHIQIGPPSSHPFSLFLGINSYFGSLLKLIQCPPSIFFH